ncbi:MAG: hypothetical protein J6Y02_14535 [Pseudobutyrivibrio sp.]|nr:hypothetical protein [Pseudobutyrivibrio sp.]
MITKIPRMFPGGSVAPHGEPYNNMEFELDKYLRQKKRPLYIKRSLLPIPEGAYAPDGRDVVGYIIWIDNDYIEVNITNKGVANLISSDKDNVFKVRVVSLCSNSDMEYGVRVNKILRLELDTSPTYICDE